MSKDIDKNWYAAINKFMGNGVGGLVIILATLGASFFETRNDLARVQYEMQRMPSQLEQMDDTIKIDIGRDMRSELRAYVQEQCAYQNTKYNQLESRLERLENTMLGVD